MSVLEIRSLYIKRYINSAIHFVLYLLHTKLRLQAKVPVKAVKDNVNYWKWQELVFSTVSCRHVYVFIPPVCVGSVMVSALHGHAWRSWFNPRSTRNLICGKFNLTRSQSTRQRWRGFSLCRMMTRERTACLMWRMPLWTPLHAFGHAIILPCLIRPSTEEIRVTGVRFRSLLNHPAIAANMG